MSTNDPVVHGHAYMPPRPSAFPQRTSRGRGPWRGRAMVGLGLLSLLAGIVLLAAPVLGAMHRDTADQSAIQSWNSGGSGALAGAAPGTPAKPADLHCGSGSSTDFALVQFNAPASYHYVGVAGNGDWDMLHDRSMVHYSTSPAIGAVGNVIIAFHREPEYEHIDQLSVGDTVTVQDRTCKRYTYRVTQRWTLDPNAVTQLNPTTGHDLTLITCTPFWTDTQRIVWRATLVT